jgi:pimeloyl-ACP methyl ester carboxylesterase
VFVVPGARRAIHNRALDIAADYFNHHYSGRMVHLTGLADVRGKCNDVLGRVITDNGAPRRFMKTFGTILGICVLIAIALGAFYFARNTEHLPMDDAARAGVNARFARLRDGVTQYELAGPDVGRLVVLLSGATVPYYMWDPTSDALAAAGYRVLRYNYFGRGYSDRPALAYDLPTYDRQFADLLATLGARGPVDVAGVSMGGVIAADFANRHPERVRSLVLVDPAFLQMKSVPFPLGIPGLAGYVAATVMEPGMAKSQLDDFLHPEQYPDWPAKYAEQLEYKGFRNALLHTVRSGVFAQAPASFDVVAKAGFPMLIVWGRHDRTVPFARSDKVRAAFPRARFVVVEDAAHLPQYEQPRIFNRLLLDFLGAR